MKRALTRQGVYSLLQECGILQQSSRTLTSATTLKKHPHSSSSPTRGRLSSEALSRPMSTQKVSLDPADLRSPFPDVDIPNISFAEFMLKRCAEFGDLPAVTDFLTGRHYTYRQLKENTIKVASALSRRGYKKGDVIATCSVNLPEFTILVMAAAALGVIISPANPAYTGPELSRFLTHNGASAIFTIPQLFPLVKDAISDPDLPHNIKELYVFGHSQEGALFFDKLMEDDGKAFPENVDIDPKKDILLLPYSSGTTGLPKGVMLSHHNIVSNLLQFRPQLKVSPEDNTLGLLPFFHIYGLTAVQFGSLQDGGHLYTVPRFDPEVFLKVLHEKKISILHAVPPIVLFLAKHPLVSKFDLSSIKYMISGAAPLGEGLTLECQNRLKFPVYQGYGLTETSPVLSVDCDPGHPGTIGHFVANTRAKLVEVETGKPVKLGELGELCIDGPQKMLGYFHNKQATDDMIDKDGWLHTGDLGFLREDGFVVIEDRLKELIKYKGFQVPPAELEGLLLTHPAVQDVGVIGVPDDEAGELPKAYVVLKPNAKASQQDICKFVEEKVTPSKRLRGGVEFLEEIPKTQSGKILRRVLKARALQSS